MIKILILLAVVGLTTSIGIILSANKKERMMIFSELYEFNEQLLLNMKYSRQTLDKIAKNFKFVPDILLGKKLLDGSDAKFISDYVSSLGKSDALSQIDYLNERKAMISKLKDESAAEYKKYSSLYVKIFFLIGVLAAILLA